jgi:hypothetical protein
VHAEKNAFVDGRDGVISFPTAQVIIDSTTSRNGPKYGIESMDLSEYKGQIAADHDIDQLRHREARGLSKLSAKVR